MVLIDELLSKERFEGLSPAEFFYRNREIAGFSNPVRALYQTIRELVENSLDATELYGILPEIKVTVDVISPEKNIVKVRVEDNGVGIPSSEVPNVFGRVFYGSKYVIRQSRGLFGLGVKMAVLYAQMTTGSPVRVVTATPRSRRIHEFELMIDITKNRPRILKHNLIDNSKRWHGTIVELTLEGNWSGARRKVVEYIKRTALIAPYATITLKSPDVELHFKRLAYKVPEPPEIGRPHPRGVDIELLKSLIAKYSSGREDPPTLVDFLVENFEGVGRITAESFLKWAGYDPEMPIGSLTIEALDDLARKMREYDGWRRPRAHSLSPLGSELLSKGVQGILRPEFVASITRKPSSYGGHPFVVEVALAWGGEVPVSDHPLLLRFANKIPLLYDEGADVSRKVVDKIDWNTYKVKFPAPLAVIVHICSTKIPFKGVGKEAIADVPEVEREIEGAIRECARKLRRYLTQKEKELSLKLKYVTISKYVDEVARALSIITGDRQEVYRRRLEEMIRSYILMKEVRRGVRKSKR